ncbi:MAG: cobalamin biosynthesis protein [Alphaproteobacteria bacterium]|nr:cobalamin biosynthesis protein [Alphaproteobacteria bacterium]
MYDNLLHFHTYFMDAQRIPFIIVAMLVTALIGIITGPMAGNANPFVWSMFDFLFGRAGDRIDRPSRSKKDLVFRGMFFTIILLILSLIIGKSLTQLTTQSSAVEGLVVVLCLSTGSIWYVVLKLYFTMRDKQETKDGYYCLSRSTRVNLNTIDDYGIVREGLVFSAISFDKSLVAPSLWYLIGGVPFLIIYSILSFGVWRFGKCGFTKGFGRTLIVLERLMGYVPSLFSGMLYTAASVIAPSANMIQGFKAWWQAKDRVPYEEGGIMLSALAWPLDISLGGPVQDSSGVTLKKTWIGPEGASAKVEAYHLKRGIIINIVANLMFLLSLSSAYVYSGHVF